MQYVQKITYVRPDILFIHIQRSWISCDQWSNNCSRITCQRERFHTVSWEVTVDITYEWGRIQKESVNVYLKYYLIFTWNPQISQETHEEILVGCLVTDRIQTFQSSTLMSDKVPLAASVEQRGSCRGQFVGHIHDTSWKNWRTTKIRVRRAISESNSVTLEYENIHFTIISAAP
jgi:hypothetical protein